MPVARLLYLYEMWQQVQKQMYPDSGDGNDPFKDVEYQ